MEEKYWRLINAYLSGSITDVEQDELIKWKNLNVQNGERFEELVKIWHASKIELEDLDFDINANWVALKNKINQQNPGVPTQIVPYYYLKIIAKIAAVFILLLSIIYLTRQSFNEEGVETYTSSNEIIKKYLPDSTIVWLNKHSNLTYPKHFDKRRRMISLSGEAFFEVRENPNQPFIITTSNSETKVLGTSFNLKAYESSNTVELSVVTGKVSFKDNLALNSQAVLNAGAFAILDKKTHSISSVKSFDTNVLSWKTNLLYFDKLPVNKVIKALENYYGITIQIKSPEISQCRFSGTFNNVRLSEILEALTLSLNMKVHLSNGAYILSGAGCGTNFK